MAEFNFLTESVQRKSVLYLYWKRLMWYNESVVLLVKVETVLMHSLHTTVFWYLYDWKISNSNSQCWINWIRSFYLYLHQKLVGSSINFSGNPSNGWEHNLPDGRHEGSSSLIVL